MHEFDIIQHFFHRCDHEQQSAHDGFHVVRGLGDDAAVLGASQDQQWGVSTDTLVEGTHFLASTDARHIGYKTLAVNLSDLAAMGAKPAWVLLSLTLPTVEEPWLQAFSEGFFELIHQYHLSLVGGDTTQGPLSITCQVGGFVPVQSPEKLPSSMSDTAAVLRSGAQVGDAIFVIGYLGGAGLGLNILTQTGKQPEHPLTEDEKNTLLLCLHRPTPHVEAGLALRGIATAAIDVSDGLLADLGHIAEQSQVGAHIFQDLLPLHPIVKRVLPLESAVQLAVTAGDDYALCCTVPPDKRHDFLSALNNLKCPYRYIGTLTDQPGVVEIYNRDAKPLTFEKTGYKHHESPIK